MNPRKLFQTAALGLTLSLSFPLPAEDWPQWRGPNRDGNCNEMSLLKSLPAAGLKDRWRAPVGPGWSSPVVVRGRVYLTDMRLEKPKAWERIKCFKESTGKLLWSHESELVYPEWAFIPEHGGGPAATPIAFPHPLLLRKEDRGRGEVALFFNFRSLRLSPVSDHRPPRRLAVGETADRAVCVTRIGGAQRRGADRAVCATVHTRFMVDFDSSMGSADRCNPRLEGIIRSSSLRRRIRIARITSPVSGSRNSRQHRRFRCLYASRPVETEITDAFG